MHRRRDDLTAACELILAFQKAVLDEAGAMVGTVGRLEVLPGAPNIIPGRVELVLEIRCFEQHRLQRVLERTRNVLEALSVKGFGWKWHEARYGSPCPMDGRVQEAIATSCASLNIPYLKLLSWAGHDGQFIGQVAPAGMIFVPSRGGISHSPREYTPWDDVERGIRVLHAATLELDRKL